MRTKTLKRALAPAWLLFGIILFFSSCKSGKETQQQVEETVLLAPDLYLIAQWEKEMELNESFYAKLDSMSKNPTVAGGALAVELEQFSADRIKLYQTNKELADIQETVFRPTGPWSGSVLPQKPPPPPPPIIDWLKRRESRVILVGRNNPLALYSTDDNTVVSIQQGQATISGGAPTKVEGGVFKTELDISSLQPGPAVLQLPGLNGSPPVNIRISVQ